MEKIFLLIAAVAFACVALSVAKPETEEHGASAHKAKHFKNGIHNPVFDSEALFGSRSNDDLLELSDEVRKVRLQNLATSHDTNKDGIIEPAELKQWVLQSFRMLDQTDANEKFVEDDTDKDGKVTYAELIQVHFGYSEEDIAAIEAKHKDGKTDKTDSDNEEEEVIQLALDDKQRFAAADLNKDNALDKDEFYAYLQPYDYPHMHDLEMERAMKDLDKDGDGFASIQEFLGDRDDELGMEADKKSFADMDKDNNEKLDKSELHTWALPDNSDIADEEVEHLMRECDENQDGQLTIDEIVTKEDEFLGSSATDYGRHLHFVKDEL